MPYTTPFYTSYDAIRAALGVTSNEITDAQLSDLNIEDLIMIELDQVYADHAVAKTTAESNYATDAEVKLWQKIKLFCQYQGAVFLLPALQTLVAQRVSDSQVTMERFMPEELEKTENKIIGMRDWLRAQLNTDYATSALAVSPVISAVPDYDPVTNE